MAHLQKLLPYLAAVHIHEQLLERIPGNDDWAAYRSSLQLARIIGSPKGVTSYALRIAPHARRVKKTDIDRTVLYVQRNRRMRRVKPEIVVLEKFNPWTVQTLPFTPRRSQALIVSRKVTKREAEKVAKDREKDRRKWSKALAHHGRREVKKDQRLDIPKKVHALPDIAFEALRLEFGLGGVKGSPHWRPALRQFLAFGLRSLLKQDHQIKRILKDSKYRAWKRLPPRVRHSVRMTEVKNYLPFQKKLGIHVRI
jgi:hypothetical protein